MKREQKNYLIAGVLCCLAGIFLIYKRSLGRYIDPWLSHGSKYKGNATYWVVVTGIGMILAGVALSVYAFSRDARSKLK